MALASTIGVLFDPYKIVIGFVTIEEAHRGLKISPEEFDEVAAELGRSLDDRRNQALAVRSNCDYYI